MKNLYLLFLIAFLIFFSIIFAWCANDFEGDPTPDRTQTKIILHEQKEDPFY